MFLKALTELDKETSCDKKVTYGHLETADKAVEAMHRKTGQVLESYKCRHCEGFHIGHAPMRAKMTTTASPDPVFIVFSNC